jgi:hypothetical protein
MIFQQLESVDQYLAIIYSKSLKSYRDDYNKLFLSLYVGFIGVHSLITFCVFCMHVQYQCCDELH